MKFRTKIYFHCLVGGFLLTALVAVAEVYVAHLQIRSYFTTMAFVLLCLVYSFVIYAFLADVKLQKPLFSAQTFKSVFLGFLITSALVSALFMIGKFGDSRGLASLREVNWAGVGLIWLFVSGVSWHNRLRRRCNDENAEVKTD